MDAQVKAEWQFVRILGALALILGGVIYYQHFQSEELNPVEQVQASPTSAKTPPSRNPSSIKDSAVSHLFTHHIQCLEKMGALTIATPVKRLRLKGALCRGQKQSSSMRLLNVSNGFVASIFWVGGGHWTSDYIDLEPGDNSLQVTFEDQRGKKRVAEVRVIRSLAPNSSN